VVHCIGADISQASQRKTHGDSFFQQQQLKQKERQQPLLSAGRLTARTVRIVNYTLERWFCSLA